MTTKNAFRQLIDEIEAIRPSLQLKLPASPKSVRLQIGKITAAQERLKVIEEKIYLFANRGIRPSTRHTYRGLKALVNSMILDGNNLRLLAEEYFYDPEGAMMLLRDLRQREVALQMQIQQLKYHGLNQSQIVFALWQAQPKSTQVYQQVVQEYNPLTR